MAAGGGNGPPVRGVSVAETEDRSPVGGGVGRVVLLVAGLNLGYFIVEFVVALAIGSVALFADSIDFVEDASVNLLILAALAWSAKARARLGMGLAAILLAPGLATLWTAWSKFTHPVPPEAAPLVLTALGALAVNLTCALMLARHRKSGGSLTRAAFLSARNDVIANVAIIAAGLITASVWRAAWPDLIVGLVIAVVNADAAREILGEAREEHRAAV
jgi:Co/Zn/Cd efflux system component